VIFNVYSAKLKLAYHGKVQVSLGVGDSAVDQFLVLRHGGGLEDQGGVGGGILGLQAADGIDISGIADDDGVFLELIELSGHFDAVVCNRFVLECKLLNFMGPIDCQRRYSCGGAVTVLVWLWVTAVFDGRYLSQMDPLFRSFPPTHNT
jgi:hypothetical protein